MGVEASCAAGAREDAMKDPTVPRADTNAVTTRLLRRPRLLFLAVALLVGSVELLVVRSAGFRAQPELLGGAVVVDLVLLLPLLWYWLVIRRGRAPGISVVPVAVAAWLVADRRASRIRHLRLDVDRLLVAAGLRWTLSVPRGSVVRIRRPSVGEDFAGDGKLSTAILQPPTVVLELGEPVLAEGPFGVSRDVTILGLTVDEPERLEEALESG